MIKTSEIYKRASKMMNDTPGLMGEVETNYLNWSASQLLTIWQMREKNRQAYISYDAKLKDWQANCERDLAKFLDKWEQS